MKLLNFSLLNEPYAVELRAFDCIWDLHNIADLEGFDQNLQDNSLEMTWHIDPNYALQKYPANSFGILFRTVEYLEVSPRDQELPHSEDGCLHAVSRILPGEPLPRDPKEIEGEQYHLLFEFQSGQKIRIGAESAEFFTRPTNL